MQRLILLILGILAVAALVSACPRNKDAAETTTIPPETNVNVNVDAAGGEGGAAREDSSATHVEHEEGEAAHAEGDAANPCHTEDGAVAAGQDGTTPGDGAATDGTSKEAAVVGTTTVVLETTKGNIEIEVHPDWSPNGAQRFLDLVNLGFYDGAPFFRVIDGFMAQFGISAKPELNAKWQPQNLTDEPLKQSNKPGYLSFAMAGPNTRSTQIFINYADNSFLDAQNFTPFAIVTSGLDIAQSLFKCEYGDQGGLALAGGVEAFKKAYPEADFIKRASVKK